MLVQFEPSSKQEEQNEDLQNKKRKRVKVIRGPPSNWPSFELFDKFFCGIAKTNGMLHVQYHGVHDMHSQIV